MSITDTKDITPTNINQAIDMAVNDQAISEDDKLHTQRRKPYIKPQAANWYRQNSFFQHYMLRELTSIPVALESLNLFWGLVSLSGNLEHWQRWVTVQSNFLMIIFHLLVIVAALYNSYTWFGAMPKAMRIQRGEKFVGENILIGGSWVTLVIILAVLAAIVYYFAH